MSDCSFTSLKSIPDSLPCLKMYRFCAELFGSLVLTPCPGVPMVLRDGVALLELTPYPGVPAVLCDGVALLLPSLPWPPSGR